MACRPIHYLNQSWNIVNSNLRNKLQWNLWRNSFIFILENTFENVVREMASIWSWPQWVNEAICAMPSAASAMTIKLDNCSWDINDLEQVSHHFPNCSSKYMEIFWPGSLIISLLRCPDTSTQMADKMQLEFQALGKLSHIRACHYWSPYIWQDMAWPSRPLPKLRRILYRTICVN